MFVIGVRSSLKLRVKIQLVPQILLTSGISTNRNLDAISRSRLGLKAKPSHVILANESPLQLRKAARS